ncbi:hypothetical protein BV911_17560 [Pseudoruegeria sp. SK021]|nr:hypothetical protein BV911_17560 [Pseudoruegeria sp. SK021]
MKNCKPSPLPLYVDLRAREIPASFMARLANRNGVTTRDFARDLGIDFFGVCYNKQDAIERLAAFGNVPCAALLRWTPVRPAAQNAHMNGQTFSRLSFSVGQMRACPACLRTHAVTGEGSAHGQMSFYGHWQLRHVSLCLTHNLPLVTLWSDKVQHRRLDIGLHLAELADDILTGTFDRQERTATDFDIWLENRLSGRTDQTWLHRFATGEAADLCTWLGEAVTKVEPQDFDPSDPDNLWRITQLGYATASKGGAPVTRVLERLQAEFGSARAGPKQVLDSFYTILGTPGSKNTRPTLREFIRSHIINHWPLGPGDNLFGEPVTTRKLHSIRTAARETGIDQRRLGNLLAQAGLVPPAGNRPDDNETLFDAAASRGLIDGLANSVGAQSVQTALGISRSQFALLRKDGYFEPQLDGTGAKPVWDLSAGRALLNSFLKNAIPVATNDNDWVGLAQAAQRLKIRPGKILNLVRNGRFNQLGRVTNGMMYSDLRVRIADVKPLLEYSASPGLTLTDFKQATHVSLPLGARLARAGIISSFEAPQKLTRLPQIFVTQASIDEFNAKFVAKSALRHWLGLNHYAITKLVRTFGLEGAPQIPARPGTDVIFEWTEVEKKLFCRWPPASNAD